MGGVPGFDLASGLGTLSFALTGHVEMEVLNGCLGIRILCFCPLLGWVLFLLVLWVFAFWLGWGMILDLLRALRPLRGAWILPSWSPASAVPAPLALP
jgi:hypothetical protein